MNQISVIALIVVVTALMMVQVPLDVRTHRLSRRATTGAMIAVTLIVVSIAVVLAMVGVYALTHRVSPRSLGWGDVLLVVPLTLALAYVSVERVLWWQFMAAFTGALHAGWARIRHRQSHVPFGPHLLVAAWLMLVFSV
jgi:leader peptidase (prepilin peptidase) / N-methyltransferase